MAKPTTVISFAYGLNLYGEPDWKDITSYVKSFNISRGKSTELDSYSTGTANVVLDNRSRAFEPGFAASPFYELIEPYGKLKIVTSDYSDFVGVIDNWSFSYAEKGIDATAEIRASDNLATLAQNVLTEQTFGAQVSGSRIKDVLYGTDVYYTEPTCISQGTRGITDDTVAEGTNVLEYLQKVAANDGGLFYARRDGVIAFEDSAFVNTGGLTTVRKNLVKNSNFAIAPTANWSGGARFTSWFFEGTHSYGNSSSYNLDYTEISATKYLTNTPYYVSFYIRSLVAQSMVIYGFMGKDNGGGLLIPNSDNRVYQNVTMAAGEVRRIDLGNVISTQPTDGITFGVTLDSGVAATGTIFIDCALVENTIKLDTYFDGGSTITPPSYQTYTFSFEGAANNSTSLWETSVSTIVDYTSYTIVCDSNFAGIQFYDIAMTYDSDKLYNSIKVIGAYESDVADEESQAKYGLKELAITDAILNTQADNDSLAQFLLSLYRIPNYRAESIVLPIHKFSVDDQNTVLNMDLLSFIKLKFKPGNSGATLEKNYQVIGVAHEVSLEEHMIVLRVSSLDNYGLVLSNQLLGNLDSNRLV